MLSTFDKILILRKVPFFKGLSSTELRELSAICREVGYSVGDVIMREGDEGSELFILENGRVRVLSGSESVALTPPAHFGEMAILGGGRRQATVEVLEPVNALVISDRDFRELIMKHPGIVFPVVRSMLERLSQNARPQSGSRPGST